uniref:DNA replication licensing factor MCM3 n=1 Tax=Rhabditophanes sp. KR3021 TaxID=114890 RepID=A0AC35TMV4_9BILA
MSNLHTNNAVDVEAEHAKNIIRQQYVNFLDDANDQKIYSEKIKLMIEEEHTRLIVNINNVRTQYPDRSKRLLTHFVEEIVLFENALKQVVTNQNSKYAEEKDFHIGFEGAFGDKHVNPRSLKSSLLGALVSCEGIVIRCSQIKPKVCKSVHFCPATGKTLEKKYSDLTSYEPIISSTSYPTEDENKNPLETEFSISEYQDNQTFTIQELPECAPAGQLPRNIEIISDGDLADSCKAGDRVRAIGLYRCLPNKTNGVSSGKFRSVLIANNIELLSKDVDKPELTKKDLEDIKKIGKRPDVFELLARSLAPSIYGHEEVKKAVLCLLLGGCEKILPNGTRLRGDINCLLIGDPSVAKSQVLRYILHTAPRAIATTGRGSSGVGLTAAVVSDEGGERRLEAGAMVLADRGIVCIDEFDKMTDMDRTAIHEVMEQGRVSISKAGIHAKLNARCSVLAAANPCYGRYNVYKSPMENINMQDSLLSRFDFIFVLLDEHDMDRDRQISGHIGKIHGYRTQGEPDGQVMSFGGAQEVFTTLGVKKTKTKSSDVYETNKNWAACAKGQKILSMDFMRKYIHLAKESNPGLTEEAINYVKKVYSELRSFDTVKSDTERTTPVTARTLESLLRVSTAIAKARGHRLVAKQDAEEAYQLIHFACFKEKAKERLVSEAMKKKYASDEENNDSEDDNGDDAMETEPAAPVRKTTKRRARVNDSPINDEDETQPTASKRGRVAEDVVSISVDRYKIFKKYLHQAIVQINRREELVPTAEYVNTINSLSGRLNLTQNEMKAALSKAEDENIIMQSEGCLAVI